MSSPIRMCIVCRERFAKEQLTRLQYKDLAIHLFRGEGRSFMCVKPVKIHLTLSMP